jgi:hypothetical protein
VFAFGVHSCTVSLNHSARSTHSLLKVYSLPTHSVCSVCSCVEITLLYSFVSLCLTHYNRCIHRLFAPHALPTYCLFAAHSLPLHCLSAAYLLPIRCQFTVHHCQFTCYSLSIGYIRCLLLPKWAAQSGSCSFCVSLGSLTVASELL